MSEDSTTQNNPGVTIGGVVKEIKFPETGQRLMIVKVDDSESNAELIRLVHKRVETCGPFPDRDTSEDPNQLLFGEGSDPDGEEPEGDGEEDGEYE